MDEWFGMADLPYQAQRNLRRRVPAVLGNATTLSSWGFRPAPRRNP